MCHGTHTAQMALVCVCFELVLLKTWNPENSNEIMKGASDLSSLKDRRRLRLPVAQILLSNSPRVYNKKIKDDDGKR